VSDTRRPSPAGAAPPPLSPLRRALLEVEVGGVREWVTITLVPEGDAPRASTPDGSTSGPHVEAALALLGLGAPRQPLSIPPDRAPFRRASLPPPEDRGQVDDVRGQLGMAFEDLVTAVVRVGVDDAAEAPSVLAARERLVAAAPSPLPLPLARYLGRLKGALVSRDVVSAARLLEQASRFATDVRPLLAGVGQAGCETVSDRVMAELSREWVAGTERGSLERRLLVDVETGELFFECRAQKGALSLGPCPRVLQMGLAEVDPGPSPRLVRVLQYEVAAGLTPAAYEGIFARADRAVSDVRGRYQSALTGHPGLAEPFVVFAPARLLREAGLALEDATGASLPLRDADGEGRSAALERAMMGSLEWVVGALHDQGGQLAIDPHGFGARADGTPRYVRLR
jgi:hypothetical protein